MKNIQKIRDMCNLLFFIGSLICHKKKTLDTLYNKLRIQVVPRVAKRLQA